MNFEAVIFVVAFLGGTLFATYAVAPYFDEPQRTPMIRICQTDFEEPGECDLTTAVHLELDKYDFADYDNPEVRHFATQLCASYNYQHEPREVNGTTFTDTNSHGCIPYNISIVTVP